ncbi:MAG: hypothetical protein HC899_07305 [Leptolyngbyaceae cyanobacterium SM1_4_3]|nr:hypothetical protein [Leptolyngbyaceae cyanobacterium SM1_4_3]NJO67339.1 hypothetical protein [Leptolyngbyaceae cyanobacterium RM1_405_57]
MAFGQGFSVYSRVYLPNATPLQETFSTKGDRLFSIQMRRGDRALFLLHYTKRESP